MDLGDKNGDYGKWSDLIYILRIEATAFAAELAVGTKMTSLGIHTTPTMLFHTAVKEWSF